MTQHILTISNYLYDFLSGAASVIHKVVNSAFLAIQEAQQAKAEYEIARMLSAEYKNENFSHILYMVKEGRANELIK